MASIEPRNGKWRVKVRRVGHKPLTKTFANHGSAVNWARTMEASLHARGGAERTSSRQVSLGKLLDRYEKEITPHKRGAVQERKRIGKWRKHPLAKLPIGKVRPLDMAKYRDERLGNGASPNTV